MLDELGLRDRTGDGLLDDATRRPLRFTLLIRRDVLIGAARRRSLLALEGNRRADGRDSAGAATRWRRGIRRAATTRFTIASRCSIPILR